MKSSTSFGFSSSLLFFFIVAASINVVYSQDAASIVVDSETALSCSYVLTVRTGDRANAGTDSRISVTLGSSFASKQLDITDLKKWGTMPEGHDYFEKGNEDNFRVDASECIFAIAPPCNITVTSDGSGQKPGWFLGEVDIITLLPKNIGNSYHLTTKINFDFSRWLAKDEPPYKLTASVNKCPVIVP